MKLELRGRDLRAALEHGLAQTDREGGGFLQVSGVRLEWDPRRAAGQRVVSVAVGGRALEDETTYSVAVPSYLVRGGDGYTAFRAGQGRDQRIERASSRPDRHGRDRRARRDRARDRWAHRHALALAPGEA